jgi:hypothetical protein
MRKGIKVEPHLLQIMRAYLDGRTNKEARDLDLAGLLIGFPVSNEPIGVGP